MTNKEKLKIYESRFGIIKGVIHRLGNWKNGHSISIGHLEAAYIERRNK